MFFGASFSLLSTFSEKKEIKVKMFCLGVNAKFNLLKDEYGKLDIGVKTPNDFLYPRNTVLQLFLDA